MRLVIIESPFAGDVERNLRYVRACMRDCIRRGEAPFASHALYTQPGVLDDRDPGQRNLGIATGWEWMRRADCVVFYLDLGWSNGMRDGRQHARNIGLETELRWLGSEWSGEKTRARGGFGGSV